MIARRGGSMLDQRSSRAGYSVHPISRTYLGREGSLAPRRVTPSSSGGHLVLLLTLFVS